MDLKEVPDAPNGSNTLSPLVQNPLVSAFQSVYSSFQDRRASLGLPQPGTVDTISKEVTRDVFLTNLMFSGLRAEFTKDFSISPLFQTAHSLAMGGDGNLPPYSLAALFGSYRVGSPLASLLRNQTLIPHRSSCKRMSIMTSRYALLQTTDGPLLSLPDHQYNQPQAQQAPANQCSIWRRNIPVPTTLPTSRP